MRIATFRLLDPIQAAAVAGYMCFGLFIVSLPIWVSAVIDTFGYSERTVGILGSTEVGCVALAMVIVSHYLQAIPRRRAAVAAATVVVAANLSSALAGDLGTLAISRAIGGLGEGLLGACTLSAAAGTPASQRTFAYMEAALALCASLFYKISAAQLNTSGSKGVFVTLALLQLALLPFLFLMQPDPALTTGAQAPHAKLEPVQWRAIAANGVFYCAMFSFWTFISRIGLSLQLANSSIGNILSVAFITSVASTLAVPPVVRRLGYRPVVLWEICVMALGAFAITHAGGLLVFAVFVVVLKFHFLLHSVLMNGMLARSDRSGATNGYGLSLAIIGSALGPAAGGELLDVTGKYGTLGWSTSLAFIVCLPLLLAMARYVDSRPRPVPAGGAVALDRSGPPC